MKLSPEERKERIKEYNKRRYQNMTEEQKRKRQKRKEKNTMKGIEVIAQEESYSPI